MPGNPRDMITMAERRFPVRIRIGVPPGGFGQRYSQITAWLHEYCGADSWAMTPSGMRGVLNDAVVDLLPRCHAGECVRRPVVLRLQSRDGPRCVSGCGRMSQRQEQRQACTARRERVVSVD
jgi:hypothetical protein